MAFVIRSQHQVAHPATGITSFKGFAGGEQLRAEFHGAAEKLETHMPVGAGLRAAPGLFDPGPIHNANAPRLSNHAAPPLLETSVDPVEISLVFSGLLIKVSRNQQD